MATTSDELKLPSLLVKNRNFVLLWAAYGIAAIGDHLSEMALLQERGGLARADATRIQALISFGFFLPFVLLGPLAGWWSDRFSRKTTMILADVLRGLIVFNLAAIVAQLGRWLEPARYPGVPALLSWFGPLPVPIGEPGAGLGDLAIVIPLALIGALAAFFSPARQALLPTLIRDEHLVRANALISALGTIGGITGGVIGGVLVDRLGPQGLHHNYRLNAITFFASAILVAGILMSRTRAVPHPPLIGVFTPILQGLRYVREHHRVLQMIMLGSLFWGAAGIVISCVPAIVRDVFGGSVGDVAIYRGLIVVGLAVGAGGMSIFGPSLPLQLAVIAGLSGGAFWVLALDAAYLLFGQDPSAGPVAARGALSLSGILTGVCLFGIGGAGAAILVTVMATIQRLVPDSRRGRVCGVSDTCTMGAMVLTSGVLGLAPIPNLDRHIPWLLLAVGLALASGLIFAYREFRKTFISRPVTTFWWWVLKLYAKFWLRMRRQGACTIPTSGPVIVAANHTCGVDPILLLAASPHRLIGFLVEEKYYNSPLARYFMKQVDCVPINRLSPGKSFLSGCLRLLRAGGVLGVFPQGHFEVPGEAPPETKAGVAMLALRSGAPVIPCHISGTNYHSSPHRAFLMRHRPVVRFGKPIDLSAYANRARDRAAQAEAAELIMQRIRELAPPAQTREKPESA